MLRFRKEERKTWAGGRLQANMGISRLFPAEKVSTVTKRDIRGDTHLCSLKRDSVTWKQRSHKQASGFRNAESPENAPASAFLAFC